MSLSQRGDDGRGTCATCDARVGSGLSIECVLPLALTETFVPLLSLSQINVGKGAWAVLQNGMHAPEWLAVATPPSWPQGPSVPWEVPERDPLPQFQAAGLLALLAFPAVFAPCLRAEPCAHHTPRIIRRLLSTHREPPPTPSVLQNVPFG